MFDAYFIILFHQIYESILNAYLKHSGIFRKYIEWIFTQIIPSDIRKYIKCIFNTFRYIKKVYWMDIYSDYSII